jgi:hypothetical protein
MRLPFFGSMVWEDVYYRKQDGPWIPEQVSYRTQSFSAASVHGESKAIAGSVRASRADHNDDYKGFDSVVPGSSVPRPGNAISAAVDGKAIKPRPKKAPNSNVDKQRRAEEDLARDVFAAGQMDEDADRMQNVNIDDTNVSATEDIDDATEEYEEGEDSPQEGAGQDGAAPESDDDLPEEPEIVPQRDSIFISGRNKSTPNVVADWSFVDVDALAAAALDGPPQNSVDNVTTKTPFSNR